MAIKKTILALLRARAVELVQRLQLGAVLEENVSLNEPRQPSAHLVRNVPPRRYAKDVVELLQRPLHPVRREQRPAGQVRSGLVQRAAAVVVDSGGLGSHAAIVAREYGIPAVMGTGTGTSALTDGQLVTVDGARGLVTAAQPGDPQR